MGSTFLAWIVVCFAIHASIIHIADRLLHTEHAHEPEQPRVIQKLVCYYDRLNPQFSIPKRELTNWLFEWIALHEYALQRPAFIQAAQHFQTCSQTTPQFVDTDKWGIPIQVNQIIRQLKDGRFQMVPTNTTCVYGHDDQRFFCQANNVESSLDWVQEPYSVVYIQIVPNLFRTLKGQTGIMSIVHYDLEYFPQRIRQICRNDQCTAEKLA